MSPLRDIKLSESVKAVLILLRSSSFIGFTTCSARFIIGTRPRAIDF